MDPPPLAGSKSGRHVVTHEALRDGSRSLVCARRRLVRAEPRAVFRGRRGANGRSPAGLLTTIPDDGKQEGGGWQESNTVLHFSDWRHRWIFPKTWSCEMIIGMPVRAKAYGPISPRRAANITAPIATVASMDVMHSRSDWIAAAYCIALRVRMEQIFVVQHPYLGARIPKAQAL
jgi:hypothetical protein